MTGNTHTKKIIQRERREKRTRAKLLGTAARPRLSVFKSNKYIYAQLINDEKGVTIVSSTDRGLSIKKKTAPKDRAAEVGTDVAKKAIKKNITQVVFDRGGFLYTGAIKSLADAARKEGLQF